MASKQEKNTVRAGESPRDWTDELLTNVIEKRASDVHLEPARDSFVIRFRVDGLLYEFGRYDLEDYEPAISKLKVISQLDITKHNMPQDGHFEFTFKDRIYNIRVATFPTIYGEAAVMRILNREDTLFDLSQLGLDGEQLHQVEHLIHQPYGMIMITGPSGSGKTTFLNSVLNILKKPENNIITIEDPVELQMEGIRQCQVNQYKDLNFGSALRAVLRQDPDILMIGEIRDSETAQIAIQASLSGKLILSTFHTLDVFGIIIRFLEMGIPRSVLAHMISGVISARLVRKICEGCRAAYHLTPDERRILGDEFTNSHQQFFKGAGCERCLNTGYYGRIGIFEVVVFDTEIRTMIVEQISATGLFNALRQRNIKTLGMSAMEKVLQGVTTLEEVFRVNGKPL